MSDYPGVYISDSGNFEELRKWQRMHENPFFNPGRRITALDVKRSLEYSRGGDRTSPGDPRPTGLPRTPAVAKTRCLRNNLALYSSATGRCIDTRIGAPPVRYKREASPEDDEEENTPPRRPATRGSVYSEAPCSSGATSRAASRQATPHPSRPLQRRPRTPSVVQTPTPIPPSTPSAPRTPPYSSPVCTPPRTAQPPRASPSVSVQDKNTQTGAGQETMKRSSMQLSTNSSSGTIKRLDDWIQSSFTTVSRDDPTDPKSYYNTHYPLVLQKIPRRRKSADSLQNLSNLAANQPELDLSFYDTVPMRRLSTPVISDLTLDELVNASGSDLRPSASENA